jgi:hypothetical protein
MAIIHYEIFHYEYCIFNNTTFMIAINILVYGKKFHSEQNVMAISNSKANAH